MNSLIIPQKLTLRLENPHREPVCVGDVLLGIHIYARQKNDFFLQPFATDEQGVSTILRNALMAEVAAHYDSGLMDYVAVEKAIPIVEIRALSMLEIEQAIRSRSTIWNTLLRGETDRWSSMQELIGAYNKAANNRVSVEAIRVSWDVEQQEYVGVLPTHIF